MKKEASPELLIKQVARRLFAERGVHDVSVREIAQVAGQRNLGIVAYYFRTKENLVREILLDGAERIDARRGDFLAKLDAAGGIKKVEDGVAAIVLPSARFSDEDQAYGSHFNRYILQLSLFNSALIAETLEGRWEDSFKRCLAELRRLMPDHSNEDKSRRLTFVITYISALLAQREEMMADMQSGAPVAGEVDWAADETLQDIIQTSSALLRT